jgi:hypothetical protein
MTLTDDHGALPAHAERLLVRLETLARHEGGGRVSHMQHMDYRHRAEQLADHLRAALAVNDVHRYASALVILRAALEHHLMDRLIFLSRLYVETYGGIKKEDVQAEYARLAALKAGPRPDIARWWWDDSGMNVVIRGLQSTKAKKGRGTIISPYYFRMDEFDPFVGPRKHVRKLAAPFWEKVYREDWAKESAAAWRRWFMLDKIRKALDVNRLLPGMGIQVDVHYGFLSAFVHPSKRGYEAIYGRNYPDRTGSFDHYASELVLLYVIRLAAAELEIYGRMAKRPPRLRLIQWDEVEKDAGDARLASAYFWFLGDGPTMRDRIDTVHTPRGSAKPRAGRPRIDPASLPLDRVKYYNDPLERLVSLHRSDQELTTGLLYQSRFERPDARFR